MRITVSEHECNIYELIARAYLAPFYPLPSNHQDEGA